MDLDLPGALDLDLDPRPGVGLGDSGFPASTTLPNGCHSLVVSSAPKRQSIAVDSSLVQQLVWPPNLNPFANPRQPIEPPSYPPVLRPCAPGLTLDVSAAALLSSPPESIGSSAASAASSQFSLGPCFSARGSLSSALTSPASAGSGISPGSCARPSTQKPSMSGRATVKRPVERGESSGDDSAAQSATGGQSAAKPKVARVERATEDFSSVVKNRLQSYTRTGQACDRCKVRCRCGPCSLRCILCNLNFPAANECLDRFARFDVMLFPKAALIA